MLCPRRIPDRAGIGSLCYCHWYLFGHLITEALDVVSGPARSGDFDDTGVIKRTLIGIEVRILPDGDQLGITDGVAPGGFLDIHRVAHRRQLAIIARLTALGIGPHDVIDFLVQFTFLIQPTFDDLDAVQIAA